MANYNQELLPSHTCGHMLVLLGEQGYAGKAGKRGYKPFPLPGDKPHYAPNREYALKHIALDVTLNFDEKSVSGVARTTLRPVNDDTSVITFDSEDTTVSKVWIEGEEDKPLSFELADKKLKINLGQPRSSEQDLTVAVEYKAVPKAGLYFIAPSEAYPDKQVHAWTQGQDTDNHHWFPCFDAPNQKATTEITATVPESMYALSNGALLETKHDEAAHTKTYHWKMAIPHSTYLVTLAVGEFVEIPDKWEDIPVPYFVLKGQEENAQVSLTKTPAMVGFFSDKIGVRYPYEKYASVCVGDFIFGGMENTTATTLTDYTLHDARAHQDFSSDPLLAHELAHQWFGDLLTCRDWSHGWLNEGFATYFEALWTEQDLGHDEFVYEMYGNAAAYFAEDSGSYRRPIVAYTFNQPIDLFDRHLYQKGSLVLHLIRWTLGDKLWWKAINHYVTKHRGQNVITPDLERAIEEATGYNLQPLFEQWVYKAGYPNFKIAYSFDDKTSTAKFSVSQTQEVNTETPLFTLPVEIAFQGENGERESFRVNIEQKEQTFYFRLKEKPLFASFDPAGWLVKTVEWTRPKEQLIAQLEKDSEAFGRIIAAQELGKLAGSEAIAALDKALQSDEFWAVRAEAARALAATKSPAAETVLLKALDSEKHAKVRRTIVAGLGEYRTEAAAAALTKVLQGDVTDIVEGAAAVALGKTRAPQAFETLQTALGRDSFNQVVRNGALAGLTELKDERAIAVATEWSQYGQPEQSRWAAVSALGNLGKLVKDKERDQVVDRLVELLDDPSWRTRMQAIMATRNLGEDRPIATLQRIAKAAIDGREVRYSREAIASIYDGTAKDDEVRKLREDFDKISAENKELRDRLDGLEQRLK